MYEHAKPWVSGIGISKGWESPSRSVPDELVVKVHAFTKKDGQPHGATDFEVRLIAADYKDASISEIMAAAISAAKEMAAEYTTSF